MIFNRVFLRDGRDDVYLDSFVRPSENVNTPRPAVLVIPGGAYHFHSYGEAEPVAYRFLSMGYHVFVLYYSVGRLGHNPHDTTWPQPLLDAGSAILHIRDHAEEYGVDPDQIAVCGFSAGGHLAAMCSFDWKNPILKDYFGRDSECFRVKAAILAYPELIWKTENDHLGWSIGAHLVGKPDASHDMLTGLCPIHYVNPDASPVFLIHNLDDDGVPVEGSMELARALRAAKVPCELHIFDAPGGHGYSLADDASSLHTIQKVPALSVWSDLAETWLKQYLTIELTEIPKHVVREIKFNV